MKNNQQQTVLQQPPFAEILEENNFVHWFLENGKVLILGFLIVIAMFLVGYRITYGSMMKSEVNYINAENNYQRFMSEKSETKSQEALMNLSAIMSNYPELYAKYDGLIAQKLIVEGNISESLPFANRAIDRTQSENTPLYSEYSKTALLIAEKKYEEALKNALELKQQLLKNEFVMSIESPEGILFAFNLLRIGMLQQQMKLESAELATWNEWKAAKISNEAFQKLANNFNVGQINLTNYIDAREKTLR